MIIMGQRYKKDKTKKNIFMFLVFLKKSCTFALHFFVNLKYKTLKS